MIHDPIQTIGNMIDHQSVAFIGSVDEDGYPTIKAMLPPRKRDGLSTFYFTTTCSALRTRDFKKNAKSCIYFYDNAFVRGVMMKGTIEVLTSTKVKEMFWEEQDISFFKNGIEDEEFCVLKFNAQIGRYYSNLIAKDFAICED